ncbi:MAG: riboflavin synthase [Chloroflexota bacterium]|jgi:riboflavin synthase|nr:riboflavin synthase [Chloroflexota bacterium]
MFTGIVEEVGIVRSLDEIGDGVVLSIAATTTRDGVALGDSINVNGACLTITSIDHEGFTFGLAPETLRRTNFGAVRPGSRVNLERAVRVGDRFGGHYVQGHVDRVLRIIRVRPDGDSRVISFELPEDFGRYVVEKGFIAIDGVSLTVSERFEGGFSIALIAYTQDHVALAGKGEGDLVNVEVDIMAKYVESLLAASRPATAVRS